MYTILWKKRSKCYDVFNMTHFILSNIFEILEYSPAMKSVQISTIEKFDPMLSGGFQPNLLHDTSKAYSK